MDNTSLLTVLGFLAGGAQVVKTFAPPKYAATADVASGVLLALMGKLAKGT